jgi:hypothetical protein
MRAAEEGLGRGGHPIKAAGRMQVAAGCVKALVINFRTQHDKQQQRMQVVGAVWSY